MKDLATAMIKMDDGSTLTLEVSWAVNNTILDAIYESARTGASVDLDWSFLE